MLHKYIVNSSVIQDSHQNQSESSEAKPEIDTSRTTSNQLSQPVIVDPFPLSSIELHAVMKSTRQDPEKKQVNEENKLTRIGPTEFVLSVLGFNIGLDCLLRFPFLCMKNGGGSFLLAYFTFLVTLAFPLYVLETSIGQFSGLTPIRLFGNLAPLFRGIGWCNALTCGIFNVFQSVAIGWILFYLVNSFYAPLLWSSCNHEWGNDDCYETNRTEPRPSQVTNCSDYTAQELSRKMVTANFYENYMLKISDGIDSWGTVRYQLFLSLLGAWVLVFVCAFRGIRAYGKIVHFSVLGSYAVLVVLLIRGLTLPGSQEGVLQYLTPDWQRLATPTPWIDAAQQIFWSLGPTWGALVMLSSRNRFFNNVYRDAIITPVVCALTSLLCGFVAFAFLGHKAWRLNTELPCLFNSGPQMAFIVYPDALLDLPFPQVWSVLFFTLLLLLGLNSVVCTFETLYECLADEFCRLKRREWQSKLGLACVSLLLGLPMTTNAAHYVYQLMEWYHTALLAFVALVEVICLAQIYGSGKIRENMHSMTGIKMSVLWDIYWRIPLVTILAGLLVMTIVTYGSPAYYSYSYPPGAVAFGWGLAAVQLAPLPVAAALAVGRLVAGQLARPRRDGRRRFKLKALRLLLTPTHEWFVCVKFKSEGHVG